MREPREYDEGLTAEVAGLRADLAAARAALEFYAAEHNWKVTTIADGYVPLVPVAVKDFGSVAIQALSRLGTGEALVAVRKAEDLLETAPALWGTEYAIAWAKRNTEVKARLKAIFGEVDG